MSLEDRLIKDQKKAIKRMSDPDPYYESEPSWMEYKDREKRPSLNKEKGVFEDEDLKSLNTRPSVFDASIVFDTRKG